MLLTSEVVTTIEDARKILRWYSYRWRVEEYHKLLKSGCQAESYRLAADGMKPLLAFLCVIAVDLLRAGSWLTKLNGKSQLSDVDRCIDSMG